MATVYRYECANGGRSKFWEIVVSDSDRSYTTYSGIAGTDGVKKTTTFATVRQCSEARLKLTRAKTAKGYTLASVMLESPSANVVAKPPVRRRRPKRRVRLN